MRALLDGPIGTLCLDASERGLVRCRGAADLTPLGDDSREAARHLDAACSALGEYFRGVRQDFAGLALAPEGSDFQQRVWRALRAIPFGETTTYRALAQRIGWPEAARAVGRANATNPIAIVQPCHRVIGSDGSLVGFAWGLRAKRWLLQHERTQLAMAPVERAGEASARSTARPRPGHVAAAPGAPVGEAAWR